MSLTITHNKKKFSVGDSIRVNYKIKEKSSKGKQTTAQSSAGGQETAQPPAGGKERIQAFEGVLIAIKGQKDDRTFTVLKIAGDAVRIERIFPLASPWIDSIEKLRNPKRKIRRSKLYYLRNPRARKL
ncbi:50S ribosomal protein L19 [Patescibacteria group bacterium]|nr:50S ribosomal protein L19 [Patescibacteria group bacterium]MCG2701790.1 50S ribosomal protein L19 [Candidatus Parcubacteria bacterium]MBU4264694.1 50S ribosomal protein L19 [Patescibacteria group bacterium]MBU4390649.1 50S ribosomal protein L19 [Patescibacteria group bacterium]MBU4396766.1 50S ribosomal protein L19 [Patescibacteria group bacterium]